MMSALFLTKPLPLSDGPLICLRSAQGLVKNNADIIDNDVHNFDFAHDHDVIQAQECAQILTNSFLEKKNKNGGPLKFDARTKIYLCF